jgi:hypothetical protein
VHWDDRPSPEVVASGWSLVIIVERLTRRYGSFTAVDDVSFTALPGRVTGFLGPNGAGKSTTMRMMVAALTGPRREASPSSGAGSPICPTRDSRSACSWTRPHSTPAAPAGRS